MSGSNTGRITPAEGERLAGLIGQKLILMMDNHGPLVIGATLGQALLRLIYLEDTCKIQLLAESNGVKLQQIDPKLLTLSTDTKMFTNYGKTFMTAVIRKLTREEPDFLS